MSESLKLALLAADTPGTAQEAATPWLRRGSSTVDHLRLMLINQAMTGTSN